MHAYMFKGHVGSNWSRRGLVAGLVLFVPENRNLRVRSRKESQSLRMKRPVCGWLHTQACGQELAGSTKYAHVGRNPFNEVRVVE